MSGRVDVDPSSCVPLSNAELGTWVYLKAYIVFTVQSLVLLEFYYSFPHPQIHHFQSETPVRMFPHLYLPVKAGEMEHRPHVHRSPQEVWALISFCKSSQLCVRLGALARGPVPVSLVLLLCMSCLFLQGRCPRMGWLLPTLGILGHILEQDLPRLYNDQMLYKKSLLVCFTLAIWGTIVNNSSEDKNS